MADFGAGEDPRNGTEMTQNPAAPLGHVRGIKQGRHRENSGFAAGRCALALTSGAGAEQWRSPQGVPHMACKESGLKSLSATRQKRHSMASIPHGQASLPQQGE